MARVQVGKNRRSSWSFAFRMVQVTLAVLSFSPFTCHFPSLHALIWCILWSHHVQITISTSHSLISDSSLRKKLWKIFFTKLLLMSLSLHCHIWLILIKFLNILKSCHSNHQPKKPLLSSFHIHPFTSILSHPSFHIHPPTRPSIHPSSQATPLVFWVPEPTSSKVKCICGETCRSDRIDHLGHSG